MRRLDDGEYDNQQRLGVGGKCGNGSKRCGDSSCVGAMVTADGAAVRRRSGGSGNYLALFNGRAVVAAGGGCAVSRWCDESGRSAEEIVTTAAMLKATMATATAAR